LPANKGNWADRYLRESLLRNRMRLVVAELRAFSHYVSREFAWIIRELIRVYGWSHVEPSILAEGPGTFEEKMVRRCGERPRVVLFWGGEGFLCAFKSQIAALRCAKWFVADDLPESLGEQARSVPPLRHHLFHLRLSLGGFLSRGGAQSPNCWLPHSASPDFEYSMNEHPENRLLLSGAIHPVYPLRIKSQKIDGERIRRDCARSSSRLSLWL
jgi:hypothetical protein